MVIWGEGAMYDYTVESPAPWYEYASLIKEISIGSGITTIGDYAFADCEALEHVSMARAIQKIGTKAFQNCRSIRGLELPDGLQKIGSEAFSGCTSITALTVPESVVSIGSEVFKGADILNITCSCGSAMYEYIVRNGGLHTYLPGRCGKDAWWSLDDEGNISITGTGEIDNYTIVSMPWYTVRDRIRSVQIEDGITGIGSNAFNNCTSLKEIILPDSLNKIGKMAFGNTDL